MLVPLLVPELGTATGELRLSTWLVSLGEEVIAGDRIVEVLIPGMTFDISAPISGRLVRQEKQADMPITAGDRLGWIEPTDETILPDGEEQPL